MGYTWENEQDSIGEDNLIDAYFTLSIGEAVKKYRDKFLRDLASMKNQKEAEWAWGTIKRSVQKAERDNQIPDKIKARFPQTLKEALKFYNVKN